MSQSSYVSPVCIYMYVRTLHTYVCMYMNLPLLVIIGHHRPIVVLSKQVADVAN